MIQRSCEAVHLWREIQKHPYLTFDRLAFLCGFGLDLSLKCKELSFRMGCSMATAANYLNALKRIEMVRVHGKRWFITKKGIEVVERYFPMTYVIKSA